MRSQHHRADDVDAALTRVLAMRARKQHAKAREAIDDILARHPDNAEALSVASMVASDRDDYAASAELSRRAAELDPRASLHHMMLGGAPAELGRVAEAEASYRTAAALDPRNPAILNMLAEVLIRQSRFLEAMDTAESALRINPTDLEAAGYRFAALTGAGATGDASDALVDVITMAPPRAHALLIEYGRHMREHRMHQAKATLMAAVAEAPGFSVTARIMLLAMEDDQPGPDTPEAG